MADIEWLGTGTDLSVGANWEGGVAPASGDSAIFDRPQTAGAITGGLDQSAVNLVNLIIRPDFNGTIGSSGSPMKYGALTGYVSIDPAGTTDQEIWWQVTSATNAAISNAGSSKYGCVMVDGTVTRLIVNPRTPTARIRLGAAVNLTDLIADLMGQCWIESGAALTNAFANGNANVVCEAAITNVQVGGAARWAHQGSATFNISDLKVGDRGLFLWESPGSTITLLQTYGHGRVLASSGRAKTLTNCRAYGESLVDASNGSVTFSNAPLQFGRAKILGAGSLTQIGGHGV